MRKFFILATLVVAMVLSLNAKVAEAKTVNVDEFHEEYGQELTIDESHDMWELTGSGCSYVQDEDKYVRDLDWEFPMLQSSSKEETEQVLTLMTKSFLRRHYNYAYKYNCDEGNWSLNGRFQFVCLDKVEDFYEVRATSWSFHFNVRDEHGHVFERFNINLRVVYDDEVIDATEMRVGAWTPVEDGIVDVVFPTIMVENTERDTRLLKIWCRIYQLINFSKDGVTVEVNDWVLDRDIKAKRPYSEVDLLMLDGEKLVECVRLFIPLIYEE